MKKNRKPYLKAQNGERHCIVTGEPVAREMLIRFVIGPDNIVYPDIHEKLPGRGMWVTASHNKLSEAIKRQRFYRSAERSGFKVPHDLIETVEKLLKEDCLKLVGLANKSGCVCFGFEKIKEKLKTEDFLCLLEATDGSEKEQMRLGVKDLPIFRFFTKEEIGNAIGQTFCVHLALKKCIMAQNLITHLKRLKAFMEIE
ncbi:MAG: DUF448 domain-containing protein [Alphaproteobacteria bacterium]|nr:DUF448 domain-containing protein [Alphaproteobacteria bacterium]